MFQLRKDEAAALRSQIATSNTGRGGRRCAPYVFTEQGVAMLSSALRSKTAIAVNIEIMRAFVGGCAASPTPNTIQVGDADNKFWPICDHRLMTDSANAAAVQIVAAPLIEKRIFVVRGRQVMLDEDLAELYGVETRVLVQRVNGTRSASPRISCPSSRKPRRRL